MSAQFSSSYFFSCHLFLVFAMFQLCLSDQKSDGVLCMDSERQALFQFKHGLVDEANRLASWVGAKSNCCRWAGIVCDNITGHVHEIHLRGLDGHCLFVASSDHMLRGHLSSSLLELKQLKHLDLSCNNFEQIQVPSFIGSLRNLRYLNLSESKFGGIIPPQIGNLSNLRVLSLGSLYPNYINGEWRSPSMMNMEWLSSLHRLHHLDISSIDLRKVIDWPHVINTLSSLVELHMSRCLLSNMHDYVPSPNVTSLSVLDLSTIYFYSTSILQWILSLTSLVSLDLSYCDFVEPLPNSIYSFRNLTSLKSFNARGNDFMNSSSVLKGLPSNLLSLDISQCGVSSSVLDSIHNLTSLLSLDLSLNQLTKSIPDTFGNLCNLRYIDLSLNKFVGTSLEYLLGSLFECKSPSLESLFLTYSELSGPIPYSIGRLSSLKKLKLYGNRLNGSIPDSIGRLSSLEVLYLFDNQLSGSLPASVGQLSKLIELEFSNNLLTGIVTEAHFVKLVSLKHLNGAGSNRAMLRAISKPLNAAGNNLTLRLQVENWIPPFQMLTLYLNSWDLGPQFPLWLQSQRELIQLDISNTRISSPMPHESFWQSFPNLTYLDMSRNHIKGTLFSGLPFPTTVDVFDISFNEFRGKLPSLSNGSLMPELLDLSNNYFVGSLHHFLCSNDVKKTQMLSLGNNHFSGGIPECWDKYPRLRVLNLEKNNFSGGIPDTVGSIYGLQLLNMRENKLSGRLPVSLMNLTSLQMLQLGKNELVGSIPPWIGIKLPTLRILNLRSNNLDGTIPHELCHLSYIQILDLAENNLSENIPGCFHNFSMLSRKEENSDAEIQLILTLIGVTTVGDTLMIKGQEYAYNSILGLVTLLDLSSNNFSGRIPSEITTLQGLKYLNLSRNQLTGIIPEKIGDMKDIESIDLSVNKLSGKLPISLSRLSFLSSFNVSYNNLTGRIPMSTQLQSFNESSFLGNKLCGAPLSDQCVRVEEPIDTIGDKKEDNGPQWGLIISILLGFFTGFWIVVVPLMVSISWRIVYFNRMSKLIKVCGL